jgi:hypothetical protein
MKILNKLLILSVLSLMIFSCGNNRSREQQVSAMINKIESPFFMMSMNLQTLMDKSEVMEEGVLPFTQYQIISFFLAKEVTGIDYDTDAQVIVGEGESFLPNFYGIFKVKDEVLFTELVEVEANAKILEKEGMKYAIKETEGYCLVWNEDFAVISNVPMDLAAMLSGKGNGGDKMVDNNISIIKAANDGEVNEDYVEFLKKDADIAMSFDGKPFYQYMKTMSMEENDELENLKELYEGMAYELFLNFEKGKVELELIADLDEKLKEDLKFIGEDGVSEDLLAYGKSKSPMVTGSYKVDVNGFLDYFKGISEEDYEGLLNTLDQAGMKIEEIKEAFTGEVVYMVDEIVNREEIYDFGYDEPIKISNDEPIFGVVIGVGDATIIQTKMEEIMMATSIENVLANSNTDLSLEEFMPANMPAIEMMPNGVINVGDAYIFLMEDALFMSNDSIWANVVAAGNGVKVNNPDGLLNEKPLGFYADLSKLSTLDTKSTTGEMMAGMMTVLKSFYGNASLDGGKFTLELADDSENSLKVIVTMIGSALADFEKSLNPDLEAELNEAIDDPDAAFNKLEEELKNIDLDKEVENALEKLEEIQ